MNADVRRALSKAINRDQLNQLFQGEASPMYLRFHNQQVDGAGYNPDWQSRFKDEYDYDPEVARQLLAGAGYGPSNPLKITIELSWGATNLPEQNDVLEAVGEMWQAVGVQAELETLDRVAYTTKQRALGFDSHAYLYGAGQPQNWVLNRVLTAHRQTRGNGFENYEFEAAFLNFIKTLDNTQHDALWKQVGDLDYRLHTSVPLFWLKQEVVGDPKVIGAFDYPGNMMFFYTLLWNVKAA
jgi:ABC-type transport system substrate-binding protein